MSRNHEDESQPRRVPPGEPSTKPNEPVEGDLIDVPAQPTDAEPGRADRPDLDWVEHED